MPSKSAKQHRLMAMVAHDPKAAKRLGIPKSVGRDYVEADKGHKFGSGGSMKESKAMMKKEVSFMKKKGAPKSMIKHEEAEMEGKKMRKFAAGGKTPYVPLSQRTDPESRARALAMSRAMTDKTRAPGSPQQAAVNAARGRLDAARAARGASGGNPFMDRVQKVNAKYASQPPDSVPNKFVPPVPFAKGGKVQKYARGGGIEIKGKTRGKMVKMAGGGKC